jgi:hypothetical protein
MSEGTVPPRRDGYIAVRKAELAEAIAAAGPPGESQTIADVLKLLGSLMHHEAHAKLEKLKAQYDPLDPDAPASRRDTSLAAFDAFERELGDALTRANFVEIDPDTVQTRATTKQITGLSIKPSSAGIRRVRFFARGAHNDVIPVKRWFGLKRDLVDVQTMNDVVVLVGFKTEHEAGASADRKALKQMRRGVREGAALIKHFRSVAGPELVTLHPGAKPSMRPRDQAMLAGPAVVAGVPVLLNLWPALTVIFAVLAAYFGAQGVIEESELKRALAAVSGLVAVGAFIMRQRLKYEAQTLRYQKQLADTVYFRNLANNAGVLDSLVGAGEEQDAKEAFLAYSILWREEARPLAKAELDKLCEAFLREQFGLEIDFEIHDALGKLERLGLVQHEGENLTAIAPQEALVKLDAAWDGLFSFSARR